MAERVVLRDIKSDEIAPLKYLSVCVSRAGTDAYVSFMLSYVLCVL